MSKCKEIFKIFLSKVRLYNFASLIYYSYNKGQIAKILHYICKRLLRIITIRNYLKNSDCKKLEIGSGYHTKDSWLNCDIIYGDIYLNVNKRFPFPQKSFDYVFAEHFIEHLNLEEGSKFLAKCYDILKNNGKIRLTTPDLNTIIGIYKGKLSEQDIQKIMCFHKDNHNKGLFTKCHYVNDMFRMWGHKFIYDEETLTKLLKKSGFKNIQRYGFGYSNDKDLNDMESHGNKEWMKDKFFLILEAEK